MPFWKMNLKMYVCIKFSIQFILPDTIALRMWCLKWFTNEGIRERVHSLTVIKNVITPRLQSQFSQLIFYISCYEFINYCFDISNIDIFNWSTLSIIFNDCHDWLWDTFVHENLIGRTKLGSTKAF